MITLCQLIMKIIANKEIAIITNNNDKTILNKPITKLITTNKEATNNLTTNRVNILRHNRDKIIDFIIIYNL
jgi:hypothetical protein